MRESASIRLAHAPAPRLPARLRTSAPRSAVLVYVPTVRLAKQLDKRLGPALRARGTVCELYHAQMPDARRRAVESGARLGALARGDPSASALTAARCGGIAAAFARGEMQVGFVTKAFSMGINRSVRLSWRHGVRAHANASHTRPRMCAT